MLISQNWITRIVRHANPGWGVSAAELDSGFVRVGFETEGYASIPETTGPLVIGRVENIKELEGFKKPIRHCLVNVGSANGSGDLQSIVCGARNFSEGDLVVVSLPGTVLPGNFEISARKTYGQISAGMICSAMELGLSEKQNPGIITLDPESGEPGDDARDILGLHDTIFDVNITPDRGYALSARGLCREIASAFCLKFTDPAFDPSAAGVTITVPEVSGEAAPVQIDDETKARRFGLRLVRGIDPRAASPWWLQRELMLSGQRPVNVATDITNYVMLLLGQPMHAFDARKIQGGIHVRRARKGEKLRTLDHVERALHPEDVVICDDQGIQSLAGVMGGETSEISESTTDVYLEAAIWDPIAVARTSRRHKLSSESSRRFERGVDPAIVETALDIAASLLIEIAGGTIDSGRTLIGELSAMPAISMRATRPTELAGVEYSQDVVVKRLQEVGCQVEDAASGELEVTPPTWRSDLTMPAELVEEVLRLEGLEAIPSILPTPRGGRGLSAAQRRRRAIGHALAYSGYAEILPTPFMSPDLPDMWGLPDNDPRRATVKVQNPLDVSQSHLATTLLPAMFEAVARNHARGRVNMEIFGLQQVSFHRAEKSPMPSVAQRPDDATLQAVLDSLPKQPLHVATVGVGQRVYGGPLSTAQDYSWADAVESAQIVARAAGMQLEIRQGEELPWHPGRCAELRVNGETVGYAGELHPQILEKMELPARTCAMELNISALTLEEYLPAPVLSAYPSLHQDIALVVDEDIAAESVRQVVVEGAGELLESVELFDIYRSDQLGEGKKSLAFALVFRAPDRTLRDEEVNERRMAAAELARQRLGAEMRS
ncbi:phenylalanine--tRNA ligase subunit beta [Corynebacterium poyangense]|uniref:Phenylalanine--tRNA ligase beta subunit n=1 Tax=Corynebacterium poyangense TaxID=2684405 RepID=A0A7H0SNN2_9CORY|nr:phenylalanine--tRNA ligase subunit beta [Corynebacterium poyangense]MBZ8177193.1 phenylalanine--tRNA ligase subunit beta [Corynebacterium poyangense]QNQ90157.1 phenylalanine--tRNA ligase subunit beta [Corynebacterium poyangense]